MKHQILALLAIATLSAGSLVAAEPPAMPQPVKEHQWLKKFVGEWDITTEIFAEPGKPPLQAKGTETVKSVGGFWVVGENDGEMMGMSFKGIMTFGYDPAKKKYIGTWVDSNTSTLWQYLGDVDATGNVLTLDSEGMCPMEGKVCQFRDTVEFKSADHRVLTGAKKGEDGKWQTMMTVTAKRKRAE